jgi:lipopolysaccharide/colanic/teichoic acid biosynthesis glycosyltransferase/dTDP-glucose pyrophosphorylase
VHLEQTVEASLPSRVAAAATDARPMLDRAAKRTLDIVCSLMLLLTLSPILVAVAILIRLESSGPAFYRCRRVGRDGRPFDMLKFRKMQDGAGGPPLRASDDRRYTRLGRFLSGTRLDEIPEFINVVKGDMRLVGPRPEDPHFVALEPGAFEGILHVRPGITGLSQMAFAKESDILDPSDRMADYVARILPAKLAIDRLYAERRSTWMDLKVLVWTVVAVVLGRDVAVHRSTGELNVRKRPSATPALPAKPVLAPVDAKPRAKRPTEMRDIDVVILAGGRGTRLAPYTSILPKPLMPVGERSILETVVDQLSEFGVRRVTLCVGYLSHLIRTVFDNRPSDKVDITYVQEKDALGTAAPLRLVDGLDDTFIVMNGDVLTTLDFEALVRHHRETGNLITIATHDRRIKIDYGVLHLDHTNRLQEYEEKPEIVSPVSMGIYVVEPAALEHIPAEGYFDFPNLVEALLEAEEPVGAYRYDGMWFDIGRHSDYEQAVAAWTSEVTKVPKAA